MEGRTRGHKGGQRARIHFGHLWGMGQKEQCGNPLYTTGQADAEHIGREVQWHLPKRGAERLSVHGA